MRDTPSQRKRILVLTPRYPYPVVGGDRLRIYEICKELSKNYDLTLLSLCETQEELNSALPTDGVFSQVERVYLPKWRSALNSLFALPFATPLQIAYYRSSAFAQRVDQLIDQHDLCLAHLIRTGDYVRQSRIPTVLEMTDARSLNYQRVKALRGNRQIKSLIYKVEANRLLAYERRVLKDFASVSLVSDTDRAFLCEGLDTGGNVFVASNGVNLEQFPYRARRNSEPTAVFIGNMTSVQNMDAALYFAEEILPRARAKMPLKYRVIGRIKPADIKLLERYEGVEVVANVANVNAAIGEARVGVAPIRLGAGIQNKVLEYMAAGLPVITSSIGLEGLSARPGVDILVADTPDQYVARLSDLWANEELQLSLGRNGFEYVRAHHSWTAKLKVLVDEVERLVTVS